MVVFGIEDGKKTIWQFMLGIGLAYSSGAFLFEVFGNTGILMFVARIEFYSATFRPAPSGFVGHKTGGSSASSVNNVFNNVNQYTTSMTEAKNSSSTYNMQGGNGKK